MPVAADAGGDETVCLRVSPENPNGDLEVVAARGIHLRLLATSAKDYVHKAIVEEDARDDGSDAVAVAAGAVGAAMYESGSFATLGKELAVYLTLRVGKFPDTMEALVKRHLDKGDEMSAFVTCDLYKGTFSVVGIAALVSQSGVRGSRAGRGGARRGAVRTHGLRVGHFG